MKLTLKLIIAASLGHAKWNRTTLFLNHSEVLQVFICIEKELASVELDKDASHRPKITFFIPSLVFEYDLRSTILSSVNDQSVPLMCISCASEVDYLDLARCWFVVFAAPNLLTLPRVARVVDIAALLAAIDTPLVLHLLNIEFTSLDKTS